MSDKRDQARSRWMKIFENLYPKYESLFRYGTELVVADAETLKTYGEDGKEYTLQVAPWEVGEEQSGTYIRDGRLINDLVYRGEAEGTDTDLISLQAAIEAMAPFDTNHELRDTLEGLPSVEDMGEVSDGYHTFNQLYHQRAVLFATIVNQNKDKAWKSWKHEDGKFCFDKEGEWFIVGVDTPEGSYTYHYEKKYWDVFDCEELDKGKHWDGHTEDDVTRLLSLPPVTPTEKQEHGRLIDADKLLQETFIVDEEEWTTPEIRAILENAPPVEPPKKVVAQIKVDIDEIVERIKEEYKIKDRPVCEDAISRQAVEEMIKAEMPERGMWEIEGDKEKETVCEVCVDLMQKLSELPPVTPTISEDCISRQQAIESMAPFDTNHELRDTLDNLPTVTPTERTGECGYCPTKRDGVLTIVSKGGDDE